MTSEDLERLAESIAGRICRELDLRALPLRSEVNVDRAAFAGTLRSNLRIHGELS